MDTGVAFAHALADKDKDGLLKLLDPAVDFRGLTPGRDWDAVDANDLVDRVILGSWFEPSDHIDELESVERGDVVDRQRVAYRLVLSSGGQRYLCEQQAYYLTESDKITWLRILCSGFRELDSAPALG